MQERQEFISLLTELKSRLEKDDGQWAKHVEAFSPLLNNRFGSQFIIEFVDELTDSGRANTELKERRQWVRNLDPFLREVDSVTVAVYERAKSHLPNGVMWSFDATVGDIPERLECIRKTVVKNIESWLRWVDAQPIVAKDAAPNAVESNVGDGTPAAVRAEKKEIKENAHRLAYFAATLAEQNAKRTLTDKEAWDWLRNYAGKWPEELEGYQLPAVETFSRYLTAARSDLEEQRKQPRGGRSGRSVMRRSEM